MDRGTRITVAALVAATGAAALVLQVTWQRVIAVRTGIDLVSASITITAFLGGLGLGSILGGHVADRAGRATSGRWYAAANFGIAASALVTVPALVSWVPPTAPPWVEMTAVAAIILVPTALMGASFPLLVRALVPAAGSAGSAVGRLSAINTLGSAAGAVLGGWVLLGSVGASRSVAVAAAIDLAAGGVALVLVRRQRFGLSSEPDEAPAPEASRPTVGAAGPPPTRVWPWMLLYGVTGAVAIGLETVFFRVVDAAIRSNSYTFAGVLAMWLTLFAAGAAVGSRLVRTATSPRAWLLRLQLGVAASTALALVVAVRIVPATPLWTPLRAWFNSDGIAGGFNQAALGSTFLVAVVLPLALMGPPVLLMGCSLPFAQQVVTADLGSLGRRTGQLAASNLAGNVVGGLLTSLVLVQHLGSGAAARLLVGTLAATVGVAALATRSHSDERDQERSARPRRTAGVAAVALLCVVLVGAMPTTNELWAFLHDGREVQLVVEEDRTCGSVAKVFDDGLVQLHINGASQNGYPYDDFHVALGLIPSLMVDRPDRSLAVGFGIGSTTYGLLANPKVRSVTTAELCGGNARIVRRLATPERPEFETVLTDPRQRLRTEDGRQVLREDGPRLDVVVTDTVRTTSAASGNTYSVDYYKMVRDRLAPGGVLATWIPSGRVMASVQSVFPYVATGVVNEYGESRFVVASMSPIALDPAELKERLSRSTVTTERQQALATVIDSMTTECDPTMQPISEAELNRDLFPRDEFFLNQPMAGDSSRLRCRQ